MSTIKLTSQVSSCNFLSRLPRTRILDGTDEGSSVAG